MLALRIAEVNQNGNVSVGMYPLNTLNVLRQFKGKAIGIRGLLPDGNFIVLGSFTLERYEDVLDFMEQIEDYRLVVKYLNGEVTSRGKRVYEDAVLISAFGKIE